MYRLRGRYRHFYFGLGAFFALIGLCMAGWALFMAEESGAPWILGLGAASLLSGAVTMASMRRFRYELSADAIERHGLFGVNRLLLADIRGRRSIQVQHGPPMIRLIPDSPRGKPLNIHAQLETDAHLQEWLASLPDCDRNEQQKSLDAYLQEDDGLSPEEKYGRLARAHRVSKILGGFAFALALWAVIYPHPYDLVVFALAFVPLGTLAIAAWGGAAYSLNPKHNDVRAQMVIPLVAPGGALMLRAVLDLKLFDWTDVLWATVAATAAFMLLAWFLVDSLRQERTSLLTLALLMLAYGYGGVAQANRLLDRSEPEVFEAQVLNKRVSNGKTTSYYLKLSPWGPRAESAEEDVDRDFHDRARLGDTVCVYLWAGGLKLRRYEVWECPSG